MLRSSGSCGCRNCVNAGCGPASLTQFRALCHQGRRSLTRLQGHGQPSISKTVVNHRFRIKEERPMRLPRRTLLARAAVGLGAPVILHWPANAAEFNYKCGGSLPDGHPMAIRAREAMQKIKEESGGRLDITLYTNSVLGGDTAMISQTIAGALEMYTLPLDLLAPKNPACGIFGVGYAFLGYDHIWEAMDGELGNHLRGLAERIGFHVVHNCYDHGFREITTRTKPIEKPEDLK